MNYEQFGDIETKHIKCSSEQNVSHRINPLLVVQTEGMEILRFSTGTLVLTCT
jgi:hypothetical protein